MAARPKRTVPTSRSFAESGTGRSTGSAIGEREDEDVVRMTTGDATSDADGAEESTPARAYFAIGCGSIDSAYPTGTTTAATIAAKTSTRYRFRTFTRIFQPRIGESAVRTRGRTRFKRRTEAYGSQRSNETCCDRGTCARRSSRAFIACRRFPEGVFSSWPVLRSTAGRSDD